MDRIFLNRADQIGKDALALIDSGSCQACLSRSLGAEMKQINQLQTVVSYWSFEEFIP